MEIPGRGVPRDRGRAVLNMELSGRVGSGCAFISSPPYMQGTQQYILSVASKNISAIMP